MFLHAPFTVHRTETRLRHARHQTWNSETEGTAEKRQQQGLDMMNGHTGNQLKA